MNRPTLVLLASVLCATALRAGDKDAMMPTSGFRADMLAQIDDVAKKIEDLANAVPQEKYGWRPADGIRSVSEVYMHVAGASYFFPTFWGVKAPEGLSRDAEKTVTEKGKVLEALKASVEHAKKAVAGVSDKDLEKKIKMFGSETTVRNAMLTMLNHMHEHLGQSIAYARMNGVTPPWSK